MHEKSLAIKKHTAAIHITGSVGLLARKLWNALLLHAYHDLPMQDTYTVKLKNLISDAGYNSRDYESLQEALTTLSTTAVQWNLLGKDIQHEWGTMAMLAEARIVGNTVHYSYSPTLREWLYNPKIYARLDLISQNKFRSRYGLALYEICMDWKGVNYTRKMELATFRKLMGVEEGQYKEFKRLKARVISPAVEEINEKTELTVEPILIKDGRSVSEIQFKILVKEPVLPRKKKLPTPEKSAEFDFQGFYNGLSQNEREYVDVQVMARVSSSLGKLNMKEENQERAAKQLIPGFRAEVIKEVYFDAAKKEEEIHEG